MVFRDVQFFGNHLLLRDVFVDFLRNRFLLTTALFVYFCK